MAPPHRWPASWTSSPPASRKPSSRPWTCSKPSCTGRTPTAEPARWPGRLRRGEPLTRGARTHGAGLEYLRLARLTTQIEQLCAGRRPDRRSARCRAGRRLRVRRPQPGYVTESDDFRETGSSRSPTLCSVAVLAAGGRRAADRPVMRAPPGMALCVSWRVGPSRAFSGKAMSQRHTNIICGIGVRRAGPGCLDVRQPRPGMCAGPRQLRPRRLTADVVFPLDTAGGPFWVSLAGVGRRRRAR
jgi:hypothetical protein